MTKALQGINLGGWLVAERWMTPGLFEGVEGSGEAELVRQLGRAEAIKRLEQHRSEFIQEADFAWIAAAGFDFVRLPVGYWLFEETSDFVDGENYLSSAFEWAETHHLGVILDFHGLQGSQNGEPHSGETGKVHLYRKSKRRQALNTLLYLVKKYGSERSLIGVEVINEPRWPLFPSRLLHYYREAYSIVQKYTNPEVKIIVSDAFRPLKMAKRLAKLDLGERLVLDVHLYQVYSRADRNKRDDEYSVVAGRAWQDLLREVAKCIPVMVGEWSGATGHPMRDERAVTAYIATQRRTFDEHAWAHSYWSYKVPGWGAWDYRSMHDLLQ